MKVCHFCGNKNFKTTQVQYTYKHYANFLVVNDVPCEQCEFCGEQYFKGSVLKQIEKEFISIHSHGKKVKKELIIPVEQYSEIPSSND